MSPRVPLLDADKAREIAKDNKVPEALAELSVFRMLFHNPQAARALNGMLHALLFKGQLDPRLREMVIMRIAWQRGVAYEWTHHYSFAQRVGIADADIVGLRDWRQHGAYSPAEQAVLAATDDVLETGQIGEDAWQECAKHVGDESTLVELTAVIANWCLFATLLRSFEPPLEGGVTPWPPDGVAPGA